MEWFLCFAIGIGVGWLCWKAFGLFRCLIVSLAVLSLRVEGQEGGAPVMVIKNDIPQRVGLQVFCDPYSSGHYQNSWDNPTYGYTPFPSAILEPAGTGGDYGNFVTLNDGVNMETIDGWGYMQVTPDLGFAESWTGSQWLPFHVGDTNTYHVYTGEDGSILISPQTVGGASINIGKQDTNTPWAISDTNQPSGVFVLSNQATALGGGAISNVMNARDLGAWGQNLTMAQQVGQGGGQALSNSWTADGTILTNFANTNWAGSTSTNPWPNIRQMNGTLLSTDPHQWALWTPVTSWCRKAWVISISVALIFLYKTWIDESVMMSFMIPGQKATQTVGSFLYSIVASALFGACILALPVALAGVLTLNGDTVVAGAGGFSTLYTADGSQVGYYARYAIDFLGEFVPLVWSLGVFAYSIFAKFVLARGIVLVQWVIVRLLTCFVVFGCLSAVGGVHVNYSQVAINGAGGAGSGRVLIIAGTGAAGWPPSGAWGEYGTIWGSATDGTGQVIFTPTISGSLDMNAIADVLAGDTTQILWQTGKPNMPLTNGVLNLTWYDDGATWTGDYEPNCRGAGLSVDGVQAFIEGLGVSVVSLGTLGWLRVFRKGAMNLGSLDI